MSNTIQSIDVNVPIRTAYNQWTQFEEYPKFMSAVKQVDQGTPDHVHFMVRIAGHEIEYDAQITEQVPDKRIVWESIEGREIGGVVTFERLDETCTRITLQLHYAPMGVLEKVGDLVNIVGMQTKADLQRFKQFIEKRGHETGAWRGTVEHL